MAESVVPPEGTEPEPIALDFGEPWVDPRLVVEGNPHIRSVRPTVSPVAERPQAGREVGPQGPLTWQEFLPLLPIVLITVGVLFFAVVAWTTEGFIWKLAAGICPVAAACFAALAWLAFRRPAEEAETEEEDGE